MKTEEAVETVKVLERILPETITRIPFPKTMRWADLDVHFARPLTSILALFGSSVVSFTLGDITSSNTTRGHRFMNPGNITIKAPSEYAASLEQAHVVADIETRKAAVRVEIEKAAKAVNGVILKDEELVNIVANLIEYPVVVTGTFDDVFLEVPDEVLITAMREHQKYFSVVDSNGKLLPHFVVVNNTRTNDMAVVTKGHEKVLRARLADARFFYRGDLKDKSEDRIEKLKGVLFQASLGTMYDKTMRIEALTAWLADASGAASVKEQAVKAAKLCKSDLVSQVVVEFPKLQGLMGRVYALKAGESEQTAWAVEEHYRPVSSGAALPETLAGALVALADKVDTLVGCFSAGLIPTGASDPYALRRQTIGIIQILNQRDFRFSLSALIEKSLALYGEKEETNKASVVRDVVEFIRNRMDHIITEEGFSKDVTASVTSVSIDNVPDVKRRVAALESLKKQDGFEPLAVAFKRVVNIIKKTDVAASLVVDKALFEKPCENALFDAVNTVKEKVSVNLDSADFDKALAQIATLRGPVDTFFDDVMVMADDEKIRNNRLALLSLIASLFADIADFSKITT
ncbi:MAG: glycine--tRNA ligase subunit beta [Desulfobacteraceae bacterium]|jgi:glycyl-tRNA synthetase beta chain